MENNPKKQVIARLKEAQNILVTVSDNPSVDQLAAAIGFTLVMNKLDKRATAVFSGQVPSTIEFLSPEDTIETNTDSLRDFIISLDKAKADKLKYKVEDDVVKVFITPYKTSLTEADLDFSQGDFNVDVVVALGVDNRDHIDQAIISHGRILHDATVIGVMAGPELVDVAGINWQDASASSLCEMLASISDSFKPGLFDSQIATAYLTGIVAETERFSNEKTSPKVMKLSAELMASGANQQLISTELTPAEPYSNEVSSEDDELPEPSDFDGELDNNQLDTVDEDGVLTLSHPEPPEVKSQDEYNEDSIHIDDVGEFKSAEELNAAVTEVQANAEVVNTPNFPNEEQEQNQEYSKYIPTPPEIPNPINSNTDMNKQENPSVDPLSEIPSSNELADMQQPVVDNTQSPLLSTQHDAESPRAPEVPITTDYRLDTDGESSINKPLGPEIDTNETLENIEKKVMSYETGSSETGEIGLPNPVNNMQANPSGNAIDEDAESARQAVIDAMDQAGNFDPDRPQPVESLGAVEFGEPQIVQPEQTEPSGPPPDAPPPFVPPFPTYDPTSPSQNQQ